MRYKLKCNLSGSESFMMGLSWTVLICVTAGLAGLFLPFYVIPQIIDRIEIEETE